MAKSKTHSKENHYKNIIASQKRIIRELQKQVGRADKRKERYSDLEEKEAEAFLEEEFKDRVTAPKVGDSWCPKCSNVLDILVDGDKVKIYECSGLNCNYRASRRFK